MDDYDIAQAINRRLGQMSKVVEAISKNHGPSKILKEVKKELDYVKEQNVHMLEYDLWLLETIASMWKSLNACIGLQKSKHEVVMTSLAHIQAVLGN